MNTIPPHVQIGGTIRSLTTEGLHQLMKRVKEVLNILDVASFLFLSKLFIFLFCFLYFFFFVSFLISEEFLFIIVFWTVGLLCHGLCGYLDIYMYVVHDILYCDIIENNIE